MLYIAITKANAIYFEILAKLWFAWVVCGLGTKALRTFKERLRFAFLTISEETAFL